MYIFWAEHFFLYSFFSFTCCAAIKDTRESSNFQRLLLLLLLFWCCYYYFAHLIHKDSCFWRHKRFTMHKHRIVSVTIIYFYEGAKREHDIYTDASKVHFCMQCIFFWKRNLFHKYYMMNWLDSRKFHFSFGFELQKKNMQIFTTGYACVSIRARKGGEIKVEWRFCCCCC